MQARRWGKTAAATENAPLGTLAPAIGGGYWTKTDAGWKWGENGGTFPRPGGDWTGILLRPETPRMER
jgi:hypothetical protein